MAFMPTTDAGLQAFSAQFSAQLATAGATYGVGTADVDLIGELTGAFAGSMTIVGNPTTKTPAAVVAKRSNAAALRQAIYRVAKLVYGHAGITDEQLTGLGLTVKKQPSPVLPPSAAPGLDLVGASGSTVTIHAHDTASSSKHSKAAGAIGYKVYSFVGAEYPTDPSEWTYEGDCTRSTYDVVFPESVEPGSQVWITCAWYTRTAETSPLATPVSAYTTRALQKAA